MILGMVNLRVHKKISKKKISQPTKTADEWIFFSALSKSIFD